MTRKSGSTWLLAAFTVLVTAAAACGSTNTPGTTSKGTVTVAGFGFPESSVLAQLYGQALAHDGYTINYKLNLGTRKVVAPALQSGQIDMYPGYAASELEYYNNSAGEATADPAATTTRHCCWQMSAGRRCARWRQWRGICSSATSSRAGHAISRTSYRAVCGRTTTR